MRFRWPFTHSVRMLAGSFERPAASGTLCTAPDLSTGGRPGRNPRQGQFEACVPSLSGSSDSFRRLDGHKLRRVAYVTKCDVHQRLYGRNAEVIDVRALRQRRCNDELQAPIDVVTFALLRAADGDGPVAQSPGHASGPPRHPAIVAALLGSTAVSNGISDVAAPCSPRSGATSPGICGTTTKTGPPHRAGRVDGVGEAARHGRLLDPEVSQDAGGQVNRPLQVPCHRHRLPPPAAGTRGPARSVRGRARLRRRT
jgi:hypothetical protein